MSLDIWIIDELERERRREERTPNVLELPLPLEEDAAYREHEDSEEREPASPRGVMIVDISPTSDNVIAI